MQKQNCPLRKTKLVYTKKSNKHLDFLFKFTHFRHLLRANSTLETLNKLLEFEKMCHLKKVSLLHEKHTITKTVNLDQ